MTHEDDHNYKLILKYDGTNYKGWQSQSNQRTVQQTVEQALGDIFGGDYCVFASGRTDTGVHAGGQVCNFHMQVKIGHEKLMEKMNYRLPEDVRVVNAEEVPLDFHSRYSAIAKVYRYTILRRKKPRYNRRTDVYYWGGPLSVEKIREAAKYLVGTHDFSAFGNNPGYKVPNRTKTIKKLDILDDDDYIVFDVEGSGFLYKMVRSIVGTLIWVGTGKFRSEEVKEILDSRDRSSAGPAASASGLCLVRVVYHD